MSEDYRLEGMAEFFSRRVDGYEEHMKQFVDGADEYYDVTARALGGIKPGARMLDLGAGTGLELDAIFASGAEISVTCVDMCADMLEKLRGKFAGRHEIETITGDYFTVDLGKARFDAAVAVQTLHHFTRADKLKLYRRIYEALRPGAVFVETDYVAESDDKERQYFAELARLRQSQGVAGGWVHYDTPLTVEHEMDVLREAGFADVRMAWRKENTAVLIMHKG